MIVSREGARVGIVFEKSKAAGARYKFRNYNQRFVVRFVSQISAINCVKVISSCR